MAVKQQTTNAGQRRTPEKDVKEITSSPSRDPSQTTNETPKLTPLEETAYELSIRIANCEETYKLLMEFAHKILVIAGVKII